VGVGETLVGETLVEQLGFEGMPRRLYPCTPTRLSAWLDCPRRYRMSYLDRPPPPKGPPWAHNSLGASIHNALAGWWRLPLAERTVAAAGRLVDRGWIDEGFADETQSVRCREHAIEMVQGYVAHLDPADEPLGVERTVATRTDTIAFSGRIDRLDARPAEAWVIGRGNDVAATDHVPQALDLLEDEEGQRRRAAGFFEAASGHVFRVSDMAPHAAPQSPACPHAALHRRPSGADSRPSR